MCAPAAVLAPYILAGVTAAAATGAAVMQNQQIQHAKGAAEAQQTALNAQVVQTAKIGPAQVASPVSNGADAAAVASKKRMAALQNGIMATIGTSPQGISTNSLNTPPSAYASGKTALGQ